MTEDMGIIDVDCGVNNGGTWMDGLMFNVANKKRLMCRHGCQNVGTLKNGWFTITHGHTWMKLRFMGHNRGALLHKSSNANMDQLFEISGQRKQNIWNHLHRNPGFMDPRIN